MLPVLPVEAVRPREYRLYLSAGPAPNKVGTGFRHAIAGELPILIPLIRDPNRQAEVIEGGGKNLRPGADVTLLERAWGSNKLTLKARFLSDDEVDRQRNR
jgi:hypothetical protein